mgnify:FL=1
MKKLFFTSLVTMAVVLGMLSTSMAACNSIACKGYIERLFFSNNNLYIATDGDETALDCTAPADVYVTIDTNDSMLNQKYALLLVALSQKKPVTIRIVNGDPKCAVSYVYMDN